MDVNLKLPQDVGANGYVNPVKQGGFSVKSSPEPQKMSDPAVLSLSSAATAGGTETETAEQKAASPNPFTKEELATVAADLSDFMQSLNTHIEFSIHEKSGRMMVKVVDTKTQDVLKEFPPEKLLDTIGAIREYVGVLLDKKA
ncbi:MAG: flagellar protein FlaG [Veillonellaceae bacterium]|jgi:flagellar protein FlaG|nr:flagellar protein FlaG [Veillonellaceae bacterium]